MDPLVLRLGLALAIGLLVGIERGWRGVLLVAELAGLADAVASRLLAPIV